MTTSQDTFGSNSSTGKKLDIIREYLGMYQNALKFQPYLRTHYVDAFAGTGKIPLKSDSLELKLWDEEQGDPTEDSDNFIIGSTRLALEIEPPFKSYTFIEKSRSKFQELSETFGSHKHLNRIGFNKGDANTEVAKFCKNMDASDRAIIFLDPFGSQVEWSTIQTIAATEKVDLWYLFPSGVSVFRQISNRGTVDPTHVAAIDRIYGTQNWRAEFLKPRFSTDLFGNDVVKHEKVVTAEIAADFMIERLKTVFKGGVSDIKIELGKHAYPSYHLLFAWANPNPKAKALAKKLSKAAVKASDNNYGKSL